MSNLTIMVTRSILVGLFFCLFFCSYGQNNDQIKWEIRKKLTWDDFQGTPNQKIKYKALTHYILSVDSKIIDNEVVIYIMCDFSKSKSWVKSDSKVDELLKHEQTHFDIAEKHARILRKKIDNTSFDFTNESGSKKLDAMFHDALNRMSKEQKEYDHETEHGTIADKQRKWSSQIDKDIQKLNVYE